MWCIGFQKVQEGVTILGGQLMDKFKQTKLCKALKKNRILAFDYDTGTLTNGKRFNKMSSVSATNNQASFQPFLVRYYFIIPQNPSQLKMENT